MREVNRDNFLRFDWINCRGSNAARAYDGRSRRGMMTHARFIPGTSLGFSVPHVGLFFLMVRVRAGHRLPPVSSFGLCP